MSNMLTILSWNANKASVSRCNFWFKLLEIDFDVAALQEVREIPRFMEKFFEVIKRGEVAFLINKNNNIKYQENETPLDSKGCITVKLFLKEKTISITNVYLWHDTRMFRKFNDIVEYLDNFVKKNKNKQNYAIVCGDFEADENFRGRYAYIVEALNKFKEKLKGIGYEDVFSRRKERGDKNIWTFKVKTKEGVKFYQVDRFFVPRNLKIVKAELGPPEIVDKYKNEKRISDHRYILVKIRV
jgi:exonuclease III